MQIQNNGKPQKLLQCIDGDWKFYDDDRNSIICKKILAEITQLHRILKLWSRNNYCKNGENHLKR